MDEEVKLRIEPDESEGVKSEEPVEIKVKSKKAEAVTDANPLLDNPGHTEHTWLKGGENNAEEICGDCGVKREN